MNKKGQRNRARRRGSTLTGSVNTKAELGIQVVDYFDYEYGAVGTATNGGVKNYWWECGQNLFDNNPSATSGQAASFCRVRRADVYILPRIPLIGQSTDPDFNSNASAMFTVNVQTPSLTGHERPTGFTALGTNVQVTNVLPRIDTTWKKGFAIDMQKTFQSAVIRPFYYGNAQCLFSMRCLEPTDGTQYQGIGNTGFKIRVKVVLQIDQPIMPVQRALLSIVSNDDIATPDRDAAGNHPSTFTQQYVQMDIKSVRNNFS
jgi:hypothetical protein